LISTSISKKIVAYAKSNKNDLIIMGSHGRGGLDRWFMGSITEGVSRRIKCPILIIR
jgi:nucleotide-binding universal stress UspA family protein